MSQRCFTLRDTSSFCRGEKARQFVTNLGRFVAKEREAQLRFRMPG